jgi:crossover junction endodeoxyribonuclease RuvC
MRIIGVDPALRVTGYGVVECEGDRFVHIASGTISTRSDKPLQERLNAVYNGITAQIDRYKPSVMVLEKVFVHHAHTTTAFLLGQARGTIVLAAEKCSIPVVEYAATQVKKSISGQGHATKQQIQRMVVSLLAMKEIPKFFDVTDALALAMAHSYFNRNSRLAEILAANRQ